MQMDRPAWKTRVSTLMLGWALIVLGMAVWATPGFADNCGCRSGCVDMTNCPAPVPVLETLGGHSLFWHDPCGGGYVDRDRNCLFHNSTPPLWYASAEFLPLRRDQSGSQPFQAVASRDVEVIRNEDRDVVDRIVTYPRQAVLGTNDFDNYFEPGFRVTIGRALGDWYRIEGSYMGAYNWSDSASVRFVPVIPPVPFDPGTPATFDPGTPATFDPGTPASYDPDREPVFDPGIPPSFIAGTLPTFDPGIPPTPYDPGAGLLSPFSNFGDPNGQSNLDTLSDVEYQPSPLYDYNDYAKIRFTSRMDGVQLNLRRRVRMAVDPQVRVETSCLVGLRYMNIAESFWYEATSPLDYRFRQTRSVRTNNDMFGVQIGALSQLLVVDRGWIDFEMKGVMFFNDASSRIESNFYRDPAPAQAHRTSFMGDLSLMFNYQVAPAWTFRLGYNAMWLSGVALASENFLVDVNTLVSGPGALDASGSVVYHGPTIGMVLAR